MYKVSFIPLEIILHYRNYPTDLIPLKLEQHCIKKIAEQQYKFTLKEASLIKYSGRGGGATNILQDISASEWE